MSRNERKYVIIIESGGNMKEKKLTVTIESLDHQGRGIAHVDDKIIFVSNALTGEIVKIKIIKSKKKYMEAEVYQFIKKSKVRIEPICPYFHQCGGCDLLHIDYQTQIKYKEQKVKEIMKKFAQIEGIVKPIVKNEEIFEYRNKVIFQVKEKVGFYHKKSHEIVPIEKCFLISKKMNEYLAIIQNNMNLSFVNQIMMRESKTLQEFMIVFYVDDGFRKEQIPEALWFESLIIKKKDRYQVLNGREVIKEQIGNLKFKISPDSFFQVNTKQMECLYNEVLKVCQLSGKEKVLDLYCGTGTIGIFLSKQTKEVLGIEINASAIEDANSNKLENHISNIKFLCGDTADVLRTTSYNPDVVIVDPPRAGLDENATQELKKISAPKIVYVSCDPVTLARDLKQLETFYETISIVPVDMFSNTYHVECVALLKKKD